VGHGRLAEIPGRPGEASVSVSEKAGKEDEIMKLTRHAGLSEID
jgi:hypothetical protein